MHDPNGACVTAMLKKELPHEEQTLLLAGTDNGTITVWIGRDNKFKLNHTLQNEGWVQAMAYSEHYPNEVIII